MAVVDAEARATASAARCYRRLDHGIISGACSEAAEGVGPPSESSSPPRAPPQTGPKGRSSPSAPPCSRLARESSSADAHPPRQRRLAVLLYSLTTVLLFADQNLLAPNLTAAADEFGFSPRERDEKLGGHIALAFFVLGAPASFVVGCLADVVARRATLFATVVFLGEGACLGTYFSETYLQLFVLRALTGISVGGTLPLVASVLGDLYPPKERSAVMAAVGMGTGVGIALGQGIAGFLGPRYGWRAPFLVVSVPALALAGLVLVGVSDPERGAMDGGNESLEGEGRCEGSCGRCSPADAGTASNSYSPESSSIEMSSIGLRSTSSGSENEAMASSPSELHRDAKDGPNCGENDDSFCDDDDESNASKGVITDVNRGRETKSVSCGTVSHLVDRRSWATQLRKLKSLLQCRTVLLVLLQGAPGCLPWGIVNTYLNDYLSENRGMTVEVATMTILAFGFGNFLGMTLGGVGGNYLYGIDPRFPSFLSGSAAILACFPMWTLINTVNASSSVPYAASVSVLAGLGSGVTGPIVKATLQNVTLPNARGQAFAFLNTFDDFGRGLGPVFVALMIASMGGRTPAFNVGVAGWALCGLINLSIFFTVRDDEERMQSALAEWSQKVGRGGDGEDSEVPSFDGTTEHGSKADSVPLLT